MILWVDDDTNVSLKSFMDEIEDEGKYQLLKAGNPDDMWKILHKHVNKIKLIIMDIMLPTGESINSKDAKMGGITGLVLLKTIKSSPEYSNIPLIIFTIIDEYEVIDWARNNKVPLLKKQETYPDMLLEEIHKILKNK